MVYEWILAQCNSHSVSRGRLRPVSCWDLLQTLKGGTSQQGVCAHPRFALTALSSQTHVGMLQCSLTGVPPTPMDTLPTTTGAWGIIEGCCNHLGRDESR